jgi:hypothetical protein
LASGAAVLRVATEASGGRGGVVTGTALHCRLVPPRTVSETTRLIPRCAPGDKTGDRVGGGAMPAALGGGVDHVPPGKLPEIMQPPLLHSRKRVLGTPGLRENLPKVGLPP